MPRRPRLSVNSPARRFMQISEAHCGPAVIQMLLAFEGVEVTQEEVAEAGGAASLIEMNGMRVDQLAQAVMRLAPHLVFYYAEHASISDLVRIVNLYRYPVGVEWQGLFEDDSDEIPPNPQTPVLTDAESSDNDYGHYSVVTHADLRRQQLIIIDPYKDYIHRDRVFHFDEFEKRWWDYNEVQTPEGELRLVKDDRLFFLVARRSVRFPIKTDLSVFR